MSAEDTRRTAIAVLAGEAVLRAADAGAIEGSLREDPVFRDEVTAWERRFSPLLGLPRAVEPSAGLWSRIESAVDEVRVGNAPVGAQVAAALPGDVLDFAAVRLGRPEPHPEHRRPSATSGQPDISSVSPTPVIDFEQAVTARTAAIQRRLSVWRRTAVGSGALAAGLAALVAVGALGLNHAAGSRYIGVVDAAGGTPPLVVSLDTGSGELMVRPVAMAAETGKSHELWAIPAGGQPVSLGTVDSGGMRPAGKMMPMGAWRDPSLVLAVSVEPQGGSPTGQPTGPVVYKGKLIQAD